MSTKLVSSIDAVARSRLVTIGVEGLLVDVAKLLSDTQISLVVVCKSDGAMDGVIIKTVSCSISATAEEALARPRLPT